MYKYRTDNDGNICNNIEYSEYTYNCFVFATKLIGKHV